MSILNFSPLSLIITLLLVIFIHLLFKFILRPFLLINYYQRQGFKAIYIPIIGDIYQQFSHAERYSDSNYQMKSWIKQDPNGYIGMVTTFGFKPYIRIGSSSLIKEFAQNQENYIKYPYAIRLFKELSQKGLIFAEGDVHKRFRKLISGSFHFDLLTKNIPAIIEITNENLKKMEEGDGLNNVDIQEVMENISGAVVSQVFFGPELNSITYKGEKLSNINSKILIDMAMTMFSVGYLVLGDWFFRLGLLKSHRVLLEDMKNLRKILEDVMLEKKKKILAKGFDDNNRDLLTLLIKEQAQNTTNSMSDSEIVDQNIIFFGAGTDTTAHFLTMCLYHLVVDEMILSTIRNEIQANIPDINSVSYEALNKLEYMSAFLKETLRLKSPSQDMFMREAIRDHKLGGINIKKGTLLNADVTAQCYNPNNFENPEVFDPKRWLNGGQKDLDPYAYTPFFAGTKNCIGQHLALLESKLILVNIVTRYDFELVDKSFQLKMVIRFLYEPLEKIRMRFKKRV